MGIVQNKTPAFTRGLEVYVDVMGNESKAPTPPAGVTKPLPAWLYNSLAFFSADVIILSSLKTHSTTGLCIRHLHSSTLGRGGADVYNRLTLKACAVSVVEDFSTPRSSRIGRRISFS